MEGKTVRKVKIVCKAASRLSETQDIPYDVFDSNRAGVFWFCQFSIGAATLFWFFYIFVSRKKGMVRICI